VVSFADSLDCVAVIGKGVTSASKLFGSFFLPALLSVLIYLFIECPDVLSVHDEKDPTAARPVTRKNARELCSDHLTGWASYSGDLTKLCIGIPQVCSKLLVNYFI